MTNKTHKDETTKDTGKDDGGLSKQTDENNLKSAGHEQQSKPVVMPPEGDAKPNVVDLDATKDVVTERLDALSEANSVGHEKNLAAAEAAVEAEAGKAETNVYGTFGREDNGNTPIVNKDGSKSWRPPGVAGAVK